MGPRSHLLDEFMRCRAGLLLLLAFVSTNHATDDDADVPPGMARITRALGELYQESHSFGTLQRDTSALSASSRRALGAIPDRERWDVDASGGSHVYGEISPSAVDALLRTLNVTAGDVVYDLGSGFGRFVTQGAHSSCSSSCPRERHRGEPLFALAPPVTHLS